MGTRVGLAYVALWAIAACEAPPPSFDRDAGEETFWAACGDASAAGGTVATAADLARLTGVTVVDGDLTITGGEIEDLTPLSSLRCVRGRLELVDTTRLTTLSGLDALVAVEDDLALVRNQALTDVSALARLRFVGPFDDNADLTIVGDHALPSLRGLDALEEVSGDLAIEADDALIDLRGLGALARVGGHVSITRHAGLERTDGLDALAVIGGHLVIENDDALVDVTLPALRAVDDAPTDVTGLFRGVEIAQCPALARVAMRRLARVDDLAIHDVPALVAVDLQGLVEVVAETRTTGHLEVVAPALEAIDLSSLEAVDGDLYVGGRALAALSIPRLATVGGDLRVGDDMTFPAPGSESVSSLDLRSLATVGGAVDIHNTELETLDGLAALASVGGDLAIEENELLLSLGLDALAALGGSLDVRSNRQLPTCAAEALEARLRAAGWTGRASFAANDDAGTCP